MKKQLHILLGLLLALCLVCTACGGAEDIADPGEGRGDRFEDLPDTPSDETDRVIYAMDASALAGTYLPTDPSGEWVYLELFADGTWELFGENADISGWLGYDTEYQETYAYEDSGSSCLFAEEDDGTLYFASYGSFYPSDTEDAAPWNPNDGRGDIPDDGRDGLTEDDETMPPDVPEEGGSQSGGDDPYYSWNSELYQRNVSEFAGVWYYEGDLSAETYIVIDASGNWSYYQRAPGAEPSEMDHGTFSYSTDEASIYYADSTVYAGVSYRVFEFDTDTLIWDDAGAYYLME